MGANERPLALMPVLELIARVLGATHGRHTVTIKFVDGGPTVLSHEAEALITRRELNLIVLPRPD